MTHEGSLGCREPATSDNASGVGHGVSVGVGRTSRCRPERGKAAAPHSRRASGVAPRPVRSPNEEATTRAAAAGLLPPMG